MTGWGGRGAGRISATVVVVIGLVLAGGGTASARPRSDAGAVGAEAGLPPVTVPPVPVTPLGLTVPTLPPVTVPPVTVPAPDDVAPTVGQLVDGTGDTVTDTLGAISGVLPDAGGVGATPTLPPAPGPTDVTDPTGSSDEGRGGGGAGTGAGNGAGAAATGEAGGGGEGPSEARRVERRLERLAGSGASLAAVDLPIAPDDPLDDAVRQDARHFGWPLVLGVLIALFLAFQHRADRHERKLADAPLDQGERLRFR